MTTTINGTTGVSLIQDNTVTSAKIVDGSVTPADTQVGALPSMVRVHTDNGYGSTNNKIRRFTNVVTNQGTDITYADSATLGASFTINTNGVYALSYSEQLTVAANFGISLNSSQLTTSIGTISASDRLVIGDVYAANGTESVSNTVYLAAGSVIRAHTAGVAATVNSFAQFTITRVA